MAAAPTYPFAIPSLSQTVPALPVFHNLDTNVAINAGDPIDPAQTPYAPENPVVTLDMVERAELRLLAIRQAHAGVAYGPGIMDGIAAIQRDINTIKDDLKLNNALALNHAVIGRNQLNQPIVEPLRKTTPGHKFNHPITITTGADRQGLQQPPQPAAIGDVPVNFKQDLSTYNRKDIAEMILFYNIDFGIILNDNVSQRRDKLTRFFTEY
ncbi:hypothetical protein H0H81_010485 [Sphagnurus paluster]|uniref:Uncharacterized protein n=1 Tax=Sphagnurus paluster TaxID=117069 RepID=A0A9P7K2J5_9AGAR|nr:hypothetical protein H0H81_010485 [Sphagnurus paluster]